mmetsp:Transcript_2357/g.3567  ORF Transcript_2357/g.3567 Transcript_2357/m.3567 type:complete len:83 (+) Transcript_2357:1070-1318(+)
MQQYEDLIQTKINDVWTNIQERLDQLQTDYQDEVEEIIEDCAQLKFEKMAEIKIMYKNCPEEEIADRDKEIAVVKQEMEEIK